MPRTQRRCGWLWCGLGMYALAAAVPVGAHEGDRFALVSVECPGQPAVRENRPFGELNALGDCRERLVAVIDARGQPIATLAATRAETSTSIQGKLGWPRTFAAFAGGAINVAELGDARGLATVIQNVDGTMHALAPDGQPLPGWPVPLPAATDIIAAVAAVDLLGDARDELLILPGFLHALSSEGVLLSSWPFTGGGSLGIPVGARFDVDGPIRVVFAGLLPLSFPQPGGVFVMDEGANVLPGWPALVPPFVTPQGTFRPIFHGPAVGDVTGDGLAEVVVNNSNDRQVWVFDRDGEKVSPFPVVGGPFIDDPSLGDLDLDGAQEIAFWVGLPERTRGIMVVKGDGTLMPGWPQVTNAIGNFGPAIGDVDGDGLPEVVVSTLGGAGTGLAGGGVYVWRHDGTNLPGWPKFIDFTGFANAPSIADVDGDGQGEIIVTGRTSFLPSNGVIYAWKGSGELIAGFPIVIASRPVSFGGTAVVADIDRDGIADLGVTSEPGVFASKPARIHWFDLAVPYRPEGMEWPAWAHDMARTGSYSPPVRRIGMEVTLTPALLHENLPAPPVTVVVALPAGENATPSALFLDKVDGSPVERLEGTSLGGDQAGRLVFQFEGEALRSRLGGPGQHILTFRSEVIGGVGGILFEGEATVLLSGPGSGGASGIHQRPGGTR